MINRSTLVPVIFGLLIFGIYAASATSVPTGYADADELLVSAKLFSVAHPPGFPLFITISHFMLSLGLSGNLIAGVYHTIALVCFYYLTKTLTRSVSAAIATTGILGFSYLWWTYSTVFEVTSFSNLLAILTLLFAFRWYLSTKHAYCPDYWITWIMAGMFLGHYQPALLYFPGLSFMVIDKFKSQKLPVRQSLLFILAGVCILVAVFVSTNLLLFAQNNHKSSITWSFVQNLTGWKGHILRTDYVGTDPETVTYDTAFPSPTQIDQVTFTSAWNFLVMLTNHFGVVGIALGIGGAVSVWIKHKKRATVLIGTFLLSGPYFAGYMRTSQYTFQPNLLFGIAQRQMMLGEIAFAVVIGFGIAACISKLPKQKTVFVMSVIVLQFVLNQSLLTNKSGRLQASQMAKIRLESVTPGSLIICTNDVDCYSLFYAQEIANIRQDVYVLPHAPLYKMALLKSNPDLYPYSDYELPDFLPQLIAWNVPKRPVYLTSGVNFYPDYIGWETGPFFLQPGNFLFKVETRMPQEIISPTISTPISDLDSRDTYGIGIIETISNRQAYTGFLSTKYNNRQAATAYLNESLRLDPNNAQAKELLNYLDEFIDMPSASPSAKSLIRQRTYLEPTNIQALEALQNLYLSEDDPRASIISEHIKLLYNNPALLPP